MATFHLFQQLPLELRMQIWASAFVDDRILKVRRLYPSREYWSPSPVPAVTRTCQESRKYCSYRKAFVAEGVPRYIWSKLDSDIIQMLGSVMSVLVEEDRTEKNEIRRLRIEFVTENGIGDESEFFFHNYSHRFRDFPKLNGCDVLVTDGLHTWAHYMKDLYWGVCPRSNVRIIDAKTGEWIDEDTAGPYQDWIDCDRGQTRDYQRIDDYWDAEDEEDVAKRYEAMKKMHEPLPRIDLNY
jgi:hypothetical protein